MPVTAVAALPQSEPAPPTSLVAAAKAQLAREIDGNGLKAAQIRIAREDIRSHQLLGELGVGFTLKLHRADKAGRHDAGTAVENEAAALAAAEHAARDFCRQPAAEALLKKAMQDDEAGGWGLRDHECDAGGDEYVYSFASRCTACDGKDSGCAACEGSGQITHVFRGRMRARFSFWLRRQGMDEGALAAAERIGMRDMAIRNEADIFMQPPVVRSDRLVCDACAWLPVAKLDLSLEGRFIPALVAGRSGHIVELPPILDRWLKPGISALLKLSRGSLAVDPLMDMALKSRLVRQTLQASLKHSQRQVYAALRKSYPMAVSDNYRRAAAKYAEAAIAALARQARQRAGRRVFMLATAVLGLWFFAGLRMQMAGLAAPAVPAWGADIFLVLLLAGGGAVWVGHAARRHVRDVIGLKELPTKLPATGHESFVAIFWFLLAGFVMGVFAAEPPLWAKPVASALAPLLALIRAG